MPLWQSGSGTRTVREIALLAKIELLVDEGGPDYALAKLYYAGRNTIAHGIEWDAQFFVPDIAARLTDVAAASPRHRLTASSEAAKAPGRTPSPARP